MTAGKLESSSVRLVHGWGAWGVVAFAIPFMLFMALRFAADSSSVIAGAAAAALVSWLGGLFVGYRGGGRRRPERGDLRIDDAGLHWDGKLLVARSSIRRALVAPGSDGVTVQVQTGIFGTLTLQVKDVAEGEAIVRALGFGVEQRRLEGSMVTAMGYSGYTYLAALAASFGTTAAAIILSVLYLPEGWPRGIGMVLSFIGMFVPIFWPTRLAIGADGIYVKWMWRERYIRYADIARIEQGQGTVTVISHDGARFMVLPNYNKYGLNAETVVERIREAMSLQYTPARSVAHAALARAGRPVADWLDSLRHLERAAEGGPRQAPLLLEDLWQILEDPKAAASVRAGAAAALRTRQLDDSAKRRLRIASQTIVAPHLRIAVEAAAEGDDEHLREALAEVDDEFLLPSADRERISAGRP